MPKVLEELMVLESVPDLSRVFDAVVGVSQTDWLCLFIHLMINLQALSALHDFPGTRIK
jgi:hypothetical protein